MKCDDRHVRRWGGVGRAICAIAMVLLCTSLVAAQQTQGVPVEPGDVRQAPPRETLNGPAFDGHGWLAESVIAGGTAGSAGHQRTFILHLPPRAGGFEGQRGVIRPVIDFPGAVGMTAWWRNRAYFALADVDHDAHGGIVGRRVLTIAAIRGAAGWYLYQPGERAEVLASLRGDADLVGFVGTTRGPVALLREQVNGEIKPGVLAVQPETSVWVLFGEKWERVTAPWELKRDDVSRAPVWRVGEGAKRELLSEGMTEVVNWRGGVGLIMTSEGGDALDVWLGKAAPARDDPISNLATVQPALEWTRVAYPLTRADGTEGRVDVSDGVAFVKSRATVDDALLGWSWDDRGEMTIVRLRPAGAMVLTSLTGVPESASVIPMAAPGQEVLAPGTLALVWDPRVAVGGGSGGLGGMMVREISAQTGREMYVGPARETVRQDERKLQSVVVIVMLMSVGALVFMLRGDPQVVATLPENVRLAEPLKRLGAAFVDYAPCAVIVALAQGRSALVLLTPDSILGGGGAAEIDLGPLGMAIGLSVLHTTLGEWMFGRSIGKFVLGLRVVSVAGHRTDQGTAVETEGLEERKPRLWQAGVRNIVRWTVPLMAIFALLDVAGRHPGDLTARTLVVTDKNDGS